MKSTQGLIFECLGLSDLFPFVYTTQNLGKKTRTDHGVQMQTQHGVGPTPILLQKPADAATA